MHGGELNTVVEQLRRRAPWAGRVVAAFVTATALTMSSASASDRAAATAEPAWDRAPEALFLLAQDDDLLLDDDDLLLDDDDLLFDDDELLLDDDDVVEEEEEAVEAKVVGVAGEAHEALFAEDRYPSAATCLTCHPKQYREWSVSQHSYAQLSPLYLSLNNRINELANGSNGDFCLYLPPGSLDTSLSHAAGLSDIAVCHA